MQLPSATDLTYFVEIAQSLNLSRAAEKLGVTQPSLTLSLKRLEHSVGSTLFFRSKRGMTLTPSGKHVLQQSQELLKKWREIGQDAQGKMSSVEGRVSMGCHVSVALYSLEHVLPKLIQKFPKLEFRLEHDLSRKILERIIRQELDLGLVINPTKHPDLILKPLLKDEVGVWATAKAPKHILICDPDLIQSQALFKKIKHTEHFTQTIQSSSLEVIASLAHADGGCAILPGRVAARFPGLKRLPGFPTFKDELYTVCRMESRNIQSIQAVLKAFQEGLQ